MSAKPSKRIVAIVQKGDGYCISFHDFRKDELTVDGNCLCALGEATTAWLNGEDPKTIEALMTKGHQ